MLVSVIVLLQLSAHLKRLCGLLCVCRISFTSLPAGFDITVQPGALLKKKKKKSLCTGLLLAKANPL